MQSLDFTLGRAFLASSSPVAPWRVTFEDEGVAGYFYAHGAPAMDRPQPGARTNPEPDPDSSILDAVLIYNVASLEAKEGASPRRRLAAIEWSRDGLQAVLYLDGTAQALFDFEAHRGYCRSNFPNFLDERGSAWHRNSHAWDDAVFQRFETALYV